MYTSGVPKDWLGPTTLAVMVSVTLLSPSKAAVPTAWNTFETAPLAETWRPLKRNS